MKTADEINTNTFYMLGNESIKEITMRKRGKSILKIGNMKLGETEVKIEVSTKFNWLQKKLWRYLLNIDIEDIKEEK